MVVPDRLLPVTNRNILACKDEKKPLMAKQFTCKRLSLLHLNRKKPPFETFFLLLKKYP
jgi:hypothetical protein